MRKNNNLCFLKTSERFVGAFRERFEFEQCSLVCSADANSAPLPAYKLLSLRRWANQQQQVRGGTLTVAGSGRTQLSPSLQHMRPVSQLVTGTQQSASLITHNRVFRPNSTRPPTATPFGPQISVEQQQLLMQQELEDVPSARAERQTSSYSNTSNNNLMLLTPTSEFGDNREQVVQERRSRQNQLRSPRNTNGPLSTLEAGHSGGQSAQLSERASMLADSALVHYPGAQKLLIDLANSSFLQMPPKFRLDYPLPNTTPTPQVQGPVTTSIALPPLKQKIAAAAPPPVVRSLSATDERERRMEEALEPLISTPNTELTTAEAPTPSPARFKHQLKHQKPLTPIQQQLSTSSEKATRLAGRDNVPGNSVFETVSSLRSVLSESPSANASDRDEVFSYRTPRELPPRTREANVYLNLCDVSPNPTPVSESVVERKESVSVASGPLPKSSSGRKHNSVSRQQEAEGPPTLDFPSYVRPQAPALVIASSPHSGIAASVASTHSSRSNASLIDSASPNPLVESGRTEKSSASASELSRPALHDAHAAQQTVAGERGHERGRDSLQNSRERAPPLKKKRSGTGTSAAQQQQHVPLQDDLHRGEPHSEVLLRPPGNHETEARQQAASRYSPAELQVRAISGSQPKAKAIRDREAIAVASNDLYAKNSRSVLSDAELARWNAKDNVSEENALSSNSAGATGKTRGGQFSSSASERGARSSRTQERAGTGGATRKAALYEQKYAMQSASAECFEGAGETPASGPSERIQRANCSGNRREPEDTSGPLRSNANSTGLKVELHSKSLPQNATSAIDSANQLARGSSRNGGTEIKRSNDLNDLIDPHTGVIRRAKIHRLRTRRQSSESTTSTSNPTDSTSGDLMIAEAPASGGQSGGFPSPSEYENTGSDFSERVHVEKLWQQKLHSDSNRAIVREEQQPSRKQNTRSPAAAACAPASVARASLSLGRAAQSSDAQHDADSTRAEIESNSSLEDEDRRRLNRISESNAADGNDEFDVDDEEMADENGNENEAEDAADESDPEATGSSFLMGVLAPLAAASSSATRASAGTGVGAAAARVSAGASANSSSRHAAAADVATAASAATGSRGGRARRQRQQPKRPRSRGLTMRLALAFDNGAQKSSAYSDLIEKEAMKLSRALCSLNSEQGLPAEDEEELVEHQLRAASKLNPNNPEAVSPAGANRSSNDDQTALVASTSSSAATAPNAPPLSLPYKWLQLRPPSRARYTPFTISEVGDDEDEERARDTDLELDSERPYSVSEVDTEETDFDPRELLEEYSTTSAASTYDNRAQRWLTRPPPAPVPQPAPAPPLPYGKPAGRQAAAERRT